MCPKRSTPLSLACAALLAGACSTLPTPSQPQRLSENDAARIGLLLPQPVTVSEILTRSLAGEPPAELLARVRASGWDYRISEEEAARLTAAGVPVEVVDYMAATTRAEAREAEARRRALEAAQAQAWAWSTWYGYGHHPYWYPGWPYYPGNYGWIGFGVGCCP